MRQRKIILTLADAKGKNILFVLDNFWALPLNRVISKVRQGEIGNAQVVKKGEGAYIRSSPNGSREDNLDFIAISINVLMRIAFGPVLGKVYKEALRNYFHGREEFLKTKQKRGERMIYVDGRLKRTEKEVVVHLSKYKKIIISAAKNFKIDPYILGAILIDEYARMGIDDALDWLAVFGRDSSVGIAQVKIETVRKLIKANYYNPNPKDDNLSKANISKVSRKYLYKYAYQPAHSIYFAAAYLRWLIDSWAPFVDLSRKPEALGTLYSLGQKPSELPPITNRGRQIKNEFYPIAMKVLRP